MEEMGRRNARSVAEELRRVVVAERRVEARKLALVCELADVYRSVVPALEVPGGPRLVSAGADGTTDVDDFLIQELHPLLGIGPAAAWAMVRQACNLRDRHPRVWALVCSGQVPVWQGRQVAEQCQHLCRDAAAYVDERIAPALAALPWPRARRKLAGLVVTADPDLAEQRMLRARRRRFMEIEHGTDGTSWVTARVSTPDAVLLGETIRAIAGAFLADPAYGGSPDEARADALGVLVTPDGQAGRRAGDATLVVHLDQAAVANPESVWAVGRVEGPHGLDEIGPVLLDQVRELVRHRRVKVLPVLDLADDPAVDTYEVPEPMKARVRLRDGSSRFPYGTRPARGCDHDHTLPWGAGGQTAPSNLGCLDRTSHRAKTHGGWRLRQPEPGVFDWTSPLGYHYRVDRWGTHRANGPDDHGRIDRRTSAVNRQ